MKRITKKYKPDVASLFIEPRALIKDTIQGKKAITNGEICSVKLFDYYGNFPELNAETYHAKGHTFDNLFCVIKCEKEIKPVKYCELEQIVLFNNGAIIAQKYYDLIRIIHEGEQLSFWQQDKGTNNHQCEKPIHNMIRIQVADGDTVGFLMPMKMEHDYSYHLRTQKSL